LFSAGADIKTDCHYITLSVLCMMYNQTVNTMLTFVRLAEMLGDLIRVKYYSYKLWCVVCRRARVGRRRTRRTSHPTCCSSPSRWATTSPPLRPGPCRAGSGLHAQTTSMPPSSASRYRVIDMMCLCGRRKICLLPDRPSVFTPD